MYVPNYGFRPTLRLGIPNAVGEQAIIQIGKVRITVGVEAQASAYQTQNQGENFFG